MLNPGGALTSSWIMEFDLDNYCNHHNHPFNKVLVSFVVYFVYDIELRNRIEVLLP